MPFLRRFIPGVFSMNFGNTFNTCVVRARVLYAIKSSIRSCESTPTNVGETCELIISLHVRVAGNESPTRQSDINVRACW